MQNQILSSAEYAENDIIPQLYELSLDPACPDGNCVEAPPAEMQAPVGSKSPARWAYERVLLYIRNFEGQLGAGQEVAMGFAGSDAGVIRIESIGYFDPDILAFTGTDEEGHRTQLIQHVAQLNVLLRAVPVVHPGEAPRRIGFRLERELAGEAAVGSPADDTGA